MTADDAVTVNGVITTVTDSAIAPDDILKTPESRGSRTDDLGPMSMLARDETTISNIRGYHVMAIILCSLVLAAIAMCYFTWRLRYKIVLRVVIYLSLCQRLSCYWHC